MIIQCDEHVKRAVREALCAKGIDARPLDEKTRGMSDVELLSLCAEQGRVLLTNDSDFFKLGKNNQHPGIIFITDQQAAVSDVVRTILKLILTLSESDFRNSIFYIP